MILIGQFVMVAIDSHNCRGFCFRRADVTARLQALLDNIVLEEAVEEDAVDAKHDETSGEDDAEVRVWNAVRHRPHSVEDESERHEATRYERHEVEGGNATIQPMVERPLQQHT